MCPTTIHVMVNDVSTLDIFLSASDAEILAGIRMLCCLGIFIGFALGSALGGPFTYLAPALGFGLGLLADMKLMRGHHSGHGD